MKIAATVARYLMGIIFVVFGLNGFFNFIPQPPLPPGPLTQLMSAYMATHYLAFVFAVQLAAGILFLINRYVPLALTIIAPVIVNILMFHISFQPSGLPPGILVTILWFVVASRVWNAFDGIFQPRGL